MPVVFAASAATTVPLRLVKREKYGGVGLPKNDYVEGRAQWDFIVCADVVEVEEARGDGEEGCWGEVQS